MLDNVVLWVLQFAVRELERSQAGSCLKELCAESIQYLELFVLLCRNTFEFGSQTAQADYDEDDLDIQNSKDPSIVTQIPLQQSFKCRRFI
jgi:hypothetical protein